MECLVPIERQDVAHQKWAQERNVPCPTKCGGHVVFPLVTIVCSVEMFSSLEAGTCVSEAARQGMTVVVVTVRPMS